MSTDTAPGTKKDPKTPTTETATTSGTGGTGGTSTDTPGGATPSGG